MKIPCWQTLESEYFKQNLHSTPSGSWPHLSGY
jgi:hypothetical protein